MKGLIIKKTPLDKILSGKKTWEMRHCRCNLRETVALIQGGSGKVVGIAEVVNSFGPLSAEELKNSKSQHQADDQTIAENFGYKPGKVFAWEFKGARRLAKPIRYKHPNGAQTWVTLDAMDEKIMKAASDSGNL